MKKDDFVPYQKNFEEDVMCMLQALAIMKMVPVRPGKLAKTKFGALIGCVFVYVPPLVLDYYGFLKRSSGLVEKIEEMQNKFVGKQIRCVKAPVVHFASVRMEDVASLAPELVGDFPEFKKMILDARGFASKIW